MNKARRAEIDRAEALLNEALAIIQSAAEEEQDAFDRLGEGLQQSERGQSIEVAAYALDNAQSEVENAIASLAEARSA